MTKMAQALPTRNEVPAHLTWDLEAIFQTDNDWEKEAEQLEKDIPAITQYQGRLTNNAETLLATLQLQDELSERMGKLYVYAHMRNDQDTTNDFYQGMDQKASRLLTIFNSTLSFITPEILQIDEVRVDAFLQENKALQQYEQALDRVLRQRAHVLSEKEEALLSQAADVFNANGQTFSMLNNADLTFPQITNESGEQVDLTHGRYIQFLESKNRDVRKAAFEAMYATYGQYKNTFASTLSGNVKKNNLLAQVKNYESARHAALDRNNIPEKVYDQLIEAIHEKLPLLHRYTKLRKEVLGVDQLHMYDLYTSLVEDVEMKVTYKEAQDLVVNSLTPLGEEYVNIVKEGYENRWIDVVENKGKRSGAYSSGTYGTQPYILMNWQDNVSNLYTLTHELGHSLHSYYTRKHQPYAYGNYSIFVAEVASTCNEALLSEYLLNTLEDDKQKLYILNYFLEGFRGTVFRQAMFAEFEHEIHTRAQKGEPLTADTFTSIYYDLNKKYFGDNIEVDESIGLEWARIPHFYMNYYVYQYATGYAAATSLAKQILTEKEPAVNRYKDFLKAGSSDYPIEVLKQAGVDMTSKQPILEALDVFEEKLNEFERLIKSK